ncbi:MAG TPA: MMPL family transporter [Rariglobus sp.]|jgi:predicted exporter|nr:MMPL family transporter [Rariglobus sp.]
MEPYLNKSRARVLLLFFAVMGLSWLGSIDFKTKISTNVADLIPTDERSPEISLLRSLADERQARVILFALTIPDATSASSDDVTTLFADTLRKSSLFAEVSPLRDTAAHDALGRFIYEKRLDLLLPTWLATQKTAFAATGHPPSEYGAWLAEKTAASLDTFLTQPEATAFQDIVKRDPLLLVPTLAQQTQSLSPSSTRAGGPALVWARLSVSPLAEEGQDSVFTVIEQALATVRLKHPGVTLEWSGVNRFAADSKHRIRAEMSWLNGLSLAAVLGIALLFVRRVWKALHLAPVILFSLLGGWVAVTLCFEHVHILVFVIGALLAGVAIDYGFYLYLQPPLHPGEPYREKLGRLMKPLLTSCLTTVIGFSFLLWSELPLIRQLGVFVSAGLLSALAAAILYFAQIKNPFLEARVLALPKHPTPTSRRLVRGLGIFALVIALTGPWLLHWHDDIHQLNVPNPVLIANDEHLRTLFGDTEDRSIYITRADSLVAARDRLAGFQAWHDRTFPDAPLASVGLILPTEADTLAQPARLADLGDFAALLRAALERHGFTADSFAPFFEAWSEHAAAVSSSSAEQLAKAYATLGADLQSRLTGPLGMLFFTGDKQTWLLSLADHPPGAEPPAALGTVDTNQLETLNTLFTRYRASALRLSLCGLAVIGASVFVLYGLRRGARIFMIPSGACFFAFGLLGLTGHTLNLFHLLGAFLGVCLSHNYAIFSAENAGRGEPPPISIRLSALCTAASFGVLALSHIPVVAALGSTVALIVITALVMVELEPLGRKN